MRRQGVSGRASRALALAAIVYGLAGVAPGVAAAQEAVDFSSQVAPLLSQRCLACHQSGDAKGGLDLSTLPAAVKGGVTGPAIVAGKPEESWLLDQVVPFFEGDEPAMPQSGDPLSDGEVALLERWITEGANWPDDLVLAPANRADKSWWSLRPLQVLAPPAAEGAPEAWKSNPIDRFVFARLGERRLEPSGPADRRTLLRRVTYDLTGLPPTAEELAAFEADEAPDAYERVVDRLLDSPRYGEQWGRHWLDVVRFGESTGFEQNIIVDNAWPFRDYVIRSLNEDKPFDRFIVEHLAGDVIGEGQPEVEVGTTFLVAGPYDGVANQDAAQAKVIRANTLDDMITATGQAFLGLTVHCARCHDHKFDPIAQTDYYRMYAAFDGVTHGERVLATPEQRQTHQEGMGPLQKRLRALQSRRGELEESILARAGGIEAETQRPFPRAAIDPHGTEDRFEPVAARQVRLTILSADRQPESPNGARIDEFEIWTDEPQPRNVALASAGARAEGVTSAPGDFAEAYSTSLVQDGQFGACWIYRGGDPRLTITLERPEHINRIVFSSDRPGAVDGRSPFNTFVGEYRIEVSLDGDDWTTVADSRRDRPPIDQRFARARILSTAPTAEERDELAANERSIADVNAAIGAIAPLPHVWAGNFEQPAQLVHVMLGGDPAREGPAVAPASLDVLNAVAPGYELPGDATEAQRRLALARWIVAAENPLTPRVLANRVWQHHFGTGLVDTPSDFGYLGSKPTHPELLDWLAAELVGNGWRLKSLHRLILLSQTYRQSGAYRDEPARRDASARFLWRFPPRRLTGEEIRDTLLQTAGVLDLTMGGPGFRLYSYLNDNVSTYVPLDQFGPETYRRTVYHQNARATRVDLLTDFDCPDTAFPEATRTATTTPLQALALWNHQFTLDMARRVAQRVGVEGSPEERCQRAFERVLLRSPSPQERTDAARLVAAHGLEALCRALLNCNELVFLE